MDLLKRYQKPGGFLQLVQLIESCTPQKQLQLLSSIEKESKIWSDEVKKKILSVDRILSWDSEALADVLSRVQELTLSIAIHGIDPNTWEKCSHLLSNSQLRRITDLSATRAPTAGEIVSSFTKIIEEVRSMIIDGYIHLPKVDPNLIIEQNIEEHLGKGGGASNLFSSTSPVKETSPSDSIIKSSDGNTQLDKEVSKLRQENNNLKTQVASLTSEVNHLRTVVAQIKRAVA